MANARRIKNVDADGPANLLLGIGSLMNLQPVDEILRGTLADFRLSRGERSVLVNLVEKLANDEQQLGLLRSRAFAIAGEKLVDPTALSVLQWLEEAVKAFQPREPQAKVEDEVLFTPGDDCPRRIGSILSHARRSMEICVFTITDDRISDEILEAHRRGVKIRIVTDNDKANDLGSDVDRLNRAGIAVRRDLTEYHMHHKFAVIDSQIALSGSYNWTRGAAEYNAENLLITCRPRLIGLFSAQFEQLWNELAPGGPL
jgi:phosphatidylserine/phosphatidylglycerophosphate/cardiolipin synthase-like enzyme